MACSPAVRGGWTAGALDPRRNARPDEHAESDRGAGIAGQDRGLPAHGTEPWEAVEATGRQDRAEPARGGGVDPQEWRADGAVRHRRYPWRGLARQPRQGPGEERHAAPVGTARHDWPA